MSILINMEMPKNCTECPCYNDELDICNITSQRTTIEDWHKRKADCPLIELPDVYINISKAFMTELCNKVCTDIPAAPLHLPHEEAKDG